MSLIACMLTGSGLRTFTLLDRDVSMYVMNVSPVRTPTS